MLLEWLIWHMEKKLKSLSLTLHNKQKLVEIDLLSQSLKIFVIPNVWDIKNTKPFFKNCVEVLTHSSSHS